MISTTAFPSVWSVSTYRLDAAARAVDAGGTGLGGRALEKARDLVDLTLGRRARRSAACAHRFSTTSAWVGALASLAASTPEVDLDLALDDCRLPEHIEVALYRIAQEGVQNVVKHSRALVATVSFAVRDRVARLEIADNGVGFDTTRANGALEAGAELHEQRLRDAVDGRARRSRRRHTRGPLAAPAGGPP